MLLITFLLLFIGTCIQRIFSYSEIDDIHPLIPCKNHLIYKSKYLWIIPCYRGIPITDYPEWCQKIKNLAQQNGMILGMHGIEHPKTNLFHRNAEFNVDVPKEKILYGREIFRRAFGYYPSCFKAPQCLATRKNITVIESLGMEYKGILNQILHKVYHCNERAQPWYLHEWFVNLL